MTRLSIGTIAMVLLLAAAGSGLASCRRAPDTPPNFKKEPVHNGADPAQPAREAGRP